MTIFGGSLSLAVAALKRLRDAMREMEEESLVTDASVVAAWVADAAFVLQALRERYEMVGELTGGRLALVERLDTLLS